MSMRGAKSTVRASTIIQFKAHDSFNKRQAIRPPALVTSGTLKNQAFT
jgi:hypothetical protein